MTIIVFGDDVLVGLEPYTKLITISNALNRAFISFALDSNTESFAIDLASSSTSLVMNNSFASCGTKPSLHLIDNYFKDAQFLDTTHQFHLTTDWNLRKPQGI